MALFDMVVLLVVGGFGVRGLMRGFVREVLSLCAVIAGVIAVRLVHAPVADWMAPHLGSEYVAALLAFVLIYGVIYVAIRLIASTASSQMRNVGLGMFDRVLGLGFGAVKGLVIVTVCFVAFTFVYNALYGELSPRPEWLRLTRTYPLLNASGDAMSSWVAQSSREGGLMGLGEEKPDNAAVPPDKAEQ